MNEALQGIVVGVTRRERKIPLLFIDDIKRKRDIKGKKVAGEVTDYTGVGIC